MVSHSKNFIPHNEALRYIERLKQKLKRKARKIQSKYNLKYIDAASLACNSFNMKNLHEFNQHCKKLEQNSEIVGHNSNRIRCALKEKTANNTNYYAFSAELDISEDCDDIDTLCLAPSRFKTLLSHWEGWANEDKTIELRAADVVRPEYYIELFNDTGDTLYIINCPHDALLWQMVWGGAALIEENLVKNSPYLSRWLTPYKNIPGWR